MKRINRYISIDEFIKLSKKFGVGISREVVNQLDDGEFLCKKITKKGNEIFYFLQKAFIQEVDLNYSCHQKIKKGKELLISNFRLPNFKKFKNS